MDDIAKIVRKYTLINSTEHDGNAQSKSILGKVLADYPDLRTKVLELKSKIDFEVIAISKISLPEQKKELNSLGGYEPPKRVEKKGLSDLDRGDKFVVRFAPNPDGAIHLGNSRPALLSDEYAKRYNGKFILRFDDTDPKVKTPEKKFYSWIKEDLKWLKIKWSAEYIASKRLPIYYKHADELIKMKKAYVCTCDEKWKKLTEKSKECPCRSLDIKIQQKRWKMMLSHKYKEGQAVLRVKTDLNHKNPAVRDWPAFRIVDKPSHPLQKNKYLWPLYNFASGIDDHLLGITHILRGQEHATNETKQRFMYDYFGWKYPETIILGRFSLADCVLSKSQIREGIENKIYNGWDDPRLGTIRSLRRRGFQADALRQIVVEIGTKPSDITIAMENLAAFNRKIIDKDANRYFFVQNPKKIKLKGLKIKSKDIPLHPDSDRGFRKFKLTDTVYIDAKDFDISKNLEVRLKDLCNIKLGETSEVTSMDVKPVPKIHWVPENHIDVKVVTPNKNISGYGEIALTKAKVGDIIQFERFGYVRLERVSPKGVVAIMTHD